MLVNRCSEIRAAKIVKSGNVYLNNFSLDIEQALQCKVSVLENKIRVMAEAAIQMCS